MGVTTDLGRRIELVSMDPHFHDISIALYRQERDNGPELRVHTYSRIAGAQQRVEFVTKAMLVLGGMELVEGSAQRLRFPCGAGHHLACKRLFLEACKAPPTAELEPRSLRIFDKKSNADVTVASLGHGAYRLTSEFENESVAQRLPAIAAGLVKLGEMQPREGDEGEIAFPCGQSHDKLVGLLLVRALNVRRVTREQETAAARGQLLAPSAQKQ